MASLFDPSTFVGSVLAATVGAGLVAVVSVFVQSARAFWVRTHHVALIPRRQLTIEALIDEAAHGAVRPLEHEARTHSGGSVTLTCGSPTPWVPPLEVSVALVERRVPVLPVWLPLVMRRPASASATCGAVALTWPDGVTVTQGPRPIPANHLPFDGRFLLAEVDASRLTRIIHKVLPAAAGESLT